MDTLRAQVIQSDVSKFDKMTLKARTDTINAIKEYLGEIFIKHNFEIQILNFLNCNHDSNRS